MNENKLRELIAFYIQNERVIHFNDLEGYKWKILSSIRNEIIEYKNRHYKNGEWDQDYSDFHEFARKTIGKTGNLVFSSSRSVMQKAADKYPEQVRKMFIDLSGIDSDTTLEERVCSFIKSIDFLAKENPDISQSGKSFHNDFRAVSVYLLMMNPHKYYNYMFTTFCEFAKFVEMTIPHAGDVHLLLEYYEVCDRIGQILELDYREWFKNYQDLQKTSFVDNETRTDTSGHLLIQDIFFSLYYYNHPEALTDDTKIVIPKKLRKRPIQRKAIPGDGRVVDYESQNRHNAAVGAAAENFVLENERRIVAGYGFDPNRIRHVSKEQGDGTGYDILSCDKNGHDIYIEVKGTEGGKDTAFYVTETEKQCSILHSENYRLYRVYDFAMAGTTGRGKIAMIEGSLEPYCLNPVAYRVEL